MTMRPAPFTERKSSNWGWVIFEFLCKLAFVVAWIAGVIWASVAVTADHWDPQNFCHGLFYMLLGGISMAMWSD